MWVGESRRREGEGRGGMKEEGWERGKRGKCRERRGCACEIIGDEYEGFEGHGCTGMSLGRFDWWKLCARGRIA